jgi:hypothetical protein
MKVFLNQIMNSGSHNNVETTTDDSSSSMQHDYHQQHEIEFVSRNTSNDNVFGYNEEDEDDDVSALTIPSSICKSYYCKTGIEPNTSALLSIETELVDDDIHVDFTVPNEIRFVPLVASVNDAANDDRNVISFDDRVIRRSFAFDEEDDNQKLSFIDNNSDASYQDDSDYYSFDHDLVDTTSMEGNDTLTHPVVKFNITNRNSQMLNWDLQKNSLVFIGGDDTNDAKCSKLARIPFKLSRPIWWTTNKRSNSNNNQYKRRRSRSFKASI